MTVKERVRNWLHSSVEINFVFLVFTFLYLTGLSLALIILSNKGLALSSYFFFYSVLQASLEVLCFIMIGLWIRQFLPKWLYTVYTGVFFLCLLAHLVNYILIRLIDTTLSYVRDLFFSEDLSHFVTSVRSLDMNPAFLAFMAIAILSIPWIGALLYKLARRFSKKQKITVTTIQCLKAFTLLTVVLLGLDVFFHPKIHFNDFLKFQKLLPLSNTFYNPKGPSLFLKTPLQMLPPEKNFSSKIAAYQQTVTDKPNIYLFVVETFRADHITDDITPNLSKFKANNISFDRAISSGNSSHISWYSIFHSNFPHHWRETKEHWKEGGVPLRLFKKLGYTTHVLASTDIKYFHMNELLFGKETRVIDDYTDLADRLDLTPDQRDLKAIQILENKLNKKELTQGQLFIVFLDSPHSNYNWPKSASKFTPIVDELDYFELISTQESLEGVKNRYKNAVNYIDYLFGKFTTTLKEKGLYEDSILVLTGDHAEEFFEDGAIFHGTHLNEYQTHIPLFYKFPASTFDLKPNQKLGTQVDIFPSILHYLTKTKPTGFFQGQSIFDSTKWPYTFTAMHNGNATPFEFYFHNGSKHFQIRSMTPQIFETQEFEIISFLDEKKESIDLTSSAPEQLVKVHFPGALDRLTEN